MFGSQISGTQGSCTDFSPKKIQLEQQPNKSPLHEELLVIKRNFRFKTNLNDLHTRKENLLKHQNFFPS